MKKVVINSDYGGFGLSSEAMVLMHMLGFPMKGTPVENSGLRIEEFTLDGPDGYRAHNHFSCILKDGLTYISNSFANDLNLRSHPVMVKVVELLKDRAGGFTSDLEIVEIDDDLPYTIDSYDGKETLKAYMPDGYVRGYTYVDITLPEVVKINTTGSKKLSETVLLVNPVKDVPSL